MKRRKHRYRGYSKRTIILTIALFCCLFFGLGYSLLGTSLGFNGEVGVNGFTSTLYGIMNKAASRGYAKTYSGAHQDSFEGSGTQPIYYWDYDSEYVSNHNNVIFADQCWQMFRTTDTGGVKLLYNGEAVDNKCLDDRGYHVGYYDVTNSDLSSSYYYGTKYEYDADSGTFSLSGDVLQGETFLYKYTCMLSTPDGTCSTLYYVSKKVDDTYDLLKIKKSAPYSTLGDLPFNNAYYSAAGVGYKFNEKNLLNYTFGGAVNIVYDNKITFSLDSFSTYYYSDEIQYDRDTRKYNLINPKLISEVSDASELEGKYIIPDGTITGSNCYYVLTIEGTLLKYRQLKDSDVYTSLYIGDSYVDNGDNTYTITNGKLVTYSEWYKGEYNNYQGYYYVCSGTSDTCRNLKRIGPMNYKNSFSYVSSNYSFYFAEDIAYQDGNYTLSGDIKKIWDWLDPNNQEILKTHHFFRASYNDSDTLNYLIEIDRVWMYYIVINGYEDVSSALEDLYDSDSTNMYDSTIKSGVELWYKNNLLLYDNYIEDTIYCNDRTISSLGSWSPTGNILVNNNYLTFANSGSINSLKCPDEIDSFSTKNPKAKLKYKIGLITNPEINILNDKSMFVGNFDYWSMSPYRTSSFAANNVITTTIDDLFTDYDNSKSMYVRPVISLVPGVEIKSGNGSKSKPYIVDAEPSDSSGIYDLQINYLNNSTSVYDSINDTLPAGEYYYYVSPNIDHMEPDLPVVEGYLTSDTTIDVNYSYIKCRLTIHYLDEDNNELSTPFIATYDYGSPYNVTSPNITGYTADMPRVSGNITADTSILVVYSPIPYSLTVKFLYDGTNDEVRPAYTATLYYNDPYSVSIPEIEGYFHIPTGSSISGTMPNRNTSLTVRYFVNTNTDPSVIDDYNTPLDP